MSPRTAERIITGAFVALLLATCVAGAAAAHYREAARQARAQGCGSPAAPVAVPRTNWRQWV